MINTVLCTAPLTAALIDTNKGVRPCCVYTPNYIGNIKEESLVNIINSNEWKTLKQQMYDNVWPAGCSQCKEREQISNWSVRTLFTDGSFDVTGWEENKLTYLEFNGSNICNLACLHCTPGFSSRWVIDNKKARTIFATLEKPKQARISHIDAVVVCSDDVTGRSTKMHLPDPGLIIENLKQLDLTNLKTINFKGGEPLLNSETLAILNYLDDHSLLQNVNIILSSNGTYINQEILDVFKKCKSILFNLSVDGVGELFNYIRYGDAKFDDIEPVIAKLNELPNIKIECQTAVMNYNIFNLLEIKEWVKNLSSKYSKVRAEGGYANCVQHPNYLSLQTLSDSTRKSLAEYYTNIDFNEFRQVIATLNGSYIGNHIHNMWVDYTELMQTVRGNNILDIVPQLVNELRYVND
jgi:radical SAM protein with 4Fe4S-binding SPASM domain